MSASLLNTQADWDSHGENMPTTAIPQKSTAGFTTLDNLAWHPSSLLPGHKPYNHIPGYTSGTNT